MHGESSVRKKIASDAMTSRLPRYEAKCVQRRCFQCGPVPLRSDIKGTQLPPANIFIPLERQLIALQLWMVLWKARVEFLLSVIELLFLSLTVEALQGKCVKTRCLREGVGHLEPKFQGEEVVPLPIY